MLEDARKHGGELVSALLLEFNLPSLSQDLMGETFTREGLSYPRTPP